MIISASRRTDIPAFFADWFFTRIREGHVLVRNPQNAHLVSKIDVSPGSVDCIVFWTKNPAPFIDRLGLLKNYAYYFLYTMTGYGRTLEPRVPALEASIKCFQSLSEHVGPGRVLWRYDPVIVTDKNTVEWHAENFEYIARCLSGFTNKCIISFVDYYKKTIKNMASIDYAEITGDEIVRLADTMKSTGSRYRIAIATCAEEIDLSEQGILHGACIDARFVEEISGRPLQIRKDQNQRSWCGCAASVDIGAYDTCPHGCLYCYANADIDRVGRNSQEHDTKSGLLYGRLAEPDRVSERVHV